MRDRANETGRRRPFRVVPALVAIVMLAGWAAPGAALPAVQWSKVDADPGFVGWRAELQLMADRFGHARANHFCIVVRAQPIAGAPDRTALVYWREEHQIQGFGPVSPGHMLDDASMAGAGTIDLRTDVVARAAEIKGSISRVTRAYVDAILRKCRLQGTNVVLLRSKGGR